MRVSKYSKNLIKTTDIGAKWKGDVPIQKNTRRFPKKAK